MQPSAMFPLGTVLFPHAPIVLRIFEPRYLTMVGHLLDEQDPAFGVVLIERGPEAGGGEIRSGVGTLARVLQVRVGADDLFVVAVGDDRVRVDDWLEDDPHPRAHVTTLPELEWKDALTPLLAEAERTVRRVLAAASGPGDEHVDDDVELSDDPVTAAWQLAEVAPLGELDRYTLLRSTTMGGLLRQINDMTLEIEVLLSALPPESRRSGEQLDEED